MSPTIPDTLDFEIEVARRVILEPELGLVDDEGVRIAGTIHHLLRGPNRLPVAFG